MDKPEEKDSQIPFDFAFVVEGDVDAVTIYDSHWRFIYLNSAAERMTGCSRAELLGRSINDVWPRAADFPEFAPIVAAMSNRKVTIAQVPSASRPGGWREARAVPIEGKDGFNGASLLVYWRDITQTRKLKLAKELADAHALAAATALDAVHDAFITLGPDYKITFANAEAGRINGKQVSDFVGRSFFDEWPTLIGSEVESICRQIMADRVAQSFIRHRQVPGTKDVWLECTCYPDEVKGGIHLVYRDITVQHERERRERFMSELSDRAQSITEPEELVFETVQAVGKYLGVDRCVFADVDLAANTSSIHKDYCRPGVGSIQGVYPLSDFGDFLTAEFQAGHAVAVEDVRNDPQKVPTGSIAAYEAIGAIAHLTVPLVHSSRLVSAIAVHSLTARQWRTAEVELLQTVVARTWLMIEVARQQRALKQVQQRDRNIAHQLQRALFPEFPNSTAGLTLRSYYRAALQEAEVGGDFADCFTYGDDRTTTISVGDVSGKGLRAASQVSSIRNMLRFSMHTNSSIENAVSQLNRVLVEQKILEGFATLFVGTFDSLSRTFTYINCGQEPGLVWRAATGAIERLEPTSPVLGAFIDSEFASSRIVLEEGDVFVLFTDGFTEAGPTRSALLTIDGVEQIFRTVLAASTNSEGALLETIANELTEGVETYAGGESSMRDDIVLVTGMLSPSPEDN